MGDYVGKWDGWGERSFLYCAASRALDVARSSYRASMGQPDHKPARRGEMHGGEGQ